MRSVIALVAVTSLAVATLAGAATVNVKRFNSKVTLAATNPFHGMVTSHKPACVKGRTVKVFHEPAGLYDTTKSSPSGTWTIPAGMPNGDFYARVYAQKKGSGAKRFVCRAARSADQHFG